MTTPDTLVRRSHRFLGKSRLCPLGVVVGLVAFCAAAPAQTKPKPAISGVPAGVATHTYDIPLLKDGYAFAQPSNQWSYFFELRPNVALVGNQFVQLNFYGSPLLKAADGSITIMLNGVPVQSRRLGGSVADQLVQWHVDLPLRWFKLGDFNELRIVSRQRTADGPCKDVDNFGDWIRFAPGCRLHLTRTDPMRYALNSYPFPYLDNLAVNLDNVVRSNWEVASGSQPTQVAEALGLASDWGAQPKYSTYGFRIHVSQGGSRGGNTISIGGQTQGSGAGPGFIDVTPGVRPGNATLTIGGASAEGIRIARKALADPSSVALMRGYSASVEGVHQAPARTVSTERGVFTFAQLGVPVVHLAGAFHQHATIFVQRPVRTDLGRESTLTIKFRHSASLNPLRSILSVYINGIPIGSARLDADNANDGEFTARIPVSELAKNLWVVDLEAYHDLAAVDCSRTYDEVAWTVVEGSSFFNLKSGALPGVPYLEAFPYLVASNGLAPSTVPISLSPNASDAELSAAAVIAARAGQVNRQSFDWDVSFGSLPKSGGSSIVIGTYDEASRLGPIANDLLISPKQGGHFAINKSLDIQEQSLGGGAILQAIQAPGSDNGVMYVLLGQDDAAIQRFADNLADPTKSIRVTGQMTAMGGDGKVLQPYTTTTLTTTNESVSAESNRYTPLMTIVMVIIVFGLILLFVWAAFQFRKRPAAR